MYYLYCSFYCEVKIIYENILESIISYIYFYFLNTCFNINILNIKSIYCIYIYI